jgi:hypothetical protein
MLVLQPALWATYNIPTSRTINWAGKAGLDPVGGIPSGSWTVTNCNVVADGSTNQRTQINSCISGAANNTVVKLPCGPIMVSGGIISMKSNVVLRGCTPLTWANFLPSADSNVTTLIIGGQYVSFDGGAKGSSWGSSINVTSGYTKDSTSLTLSSASGLAVNDWVSLYQNEDTTLMNWRGINYLGEDCGCSNAHAWQQYTKITGINGNTISIDPAVYQTSPSPSGMQVREQTFGITNAGLENIRLQGNNGNHRLVNIDFAKYVWVKGVETYGAGGSSGDVHIMTNFSVNTEVRDSVVHDGGGYNSGSNYGINSYWWNSAHKWENNTVFHTRHSIILEGGGSGYAILYNYSFDNAEGEDFGFFTQDCTPNHGANPMMNLWEGNNCQQFYSDFTQGSASYNMLLRNYGSGTRAWHPASGTPYRIGPYSRDFTLVGNVSGRSSWTGGTSVCNSGSCSSPIAYEFGVHTDGSYMDSQARSTAVLHGNYDYVTDGVSVWSDTDHALPASLYYGSKPAFFGSCAWPNIGPDVSGFVQTMPAKERATGGTACNATGSAPGQPTGLQLH